MPVIVARILFFIVNVYRTCRNGFTLQSIASRPAKGGFGLVSVSIEFYMRQRWLAISRSSVDAVLDGIRLYIEMQAFEQISLFL
jgi:molybdenum cofactor biosynthesis enzyme MoaA